MDTHKTSLPRGWEYKTKRNKGMKECVPNNPHHPHKIEPNRPPTTPTGRRKLNHGRVSLSGNLVSFRFLFFYSFTRHDFLSSLPKSSSVSCFRCVTVYINLFFRYLTNWQTYRHKETLTKTLLSLFITREAIFPIITDILKKRSKH